MIYLLALVSVLAVPAWAGTAVSDAEAASWLQRVSDASRKLPYQGIFVMQMGDRMQTVEVENHTGGISSATRLVVLDGQPREIHCSRNESVTLAWGAKGQRLERRLGSRHFPDLLPERAGKLVAHYILNLGGIDRVAGRECQVLELVPRDGYRWGFEVCADQLTGLPLRAMMVDGEGRTLVQYAFVKVRNGAVGKPDPNLPGPLPFEDLKPVDSGPVMARALPAGYEKVVAIKRKLPNRQGEVEHWVFSDGLNHISMFVEPAPRNPVGLKGQSARGMLNLLTRKLGRYQVTVLGDAPLPAVEMVAKHLALK